MPLFDYTAVLSSAAAPPSPATGPPLTPPATGPYQFGGGRPDPLTFPYDDLAAAAARVLAEDGADALTYGDAQGYPPLRDLIARKYAHYENLTVDPAQIVVTNGSSDALRLACDALVDRGDTVLVEAPTFMGTLRTIIGHGADVVGVPLDDDGIIVEELEIIIGREKAAGKRVKLLYTIPTFQNPSGVTMPRARREALLALAAREGLIVLEDDAYGDLRVEGEFVPSLYALDDHGIVVRTGTLSKILAAGLRCGWLLAQPAIVQAVLRVKYDGGTNPFVSRVATTYLADHIYPHVDELIEAYRQRRDAMLEALEEHVGREDGARWSRPHGGFFIWLRLPDAVDPVKLAQASGARGVSYVAGPAFYADWQHRWPDADRYIRLAFSFSTPDEIRAGIAQFGRALLEARR
jgi:2-aminoadipate transaminase